MGACTIYETYAGKLTPREAFMELQKEAEYQYGHDSYNGTISTCDTLTQCHGAPRFGTRAFQEFIDKRFQSMDKGDCGYIELTGDSAAVKRFKKIHGMEGKRGVRCYFFFGWAAE